MNREKDFINILRSENSTSTPTTPQEVLYYPLDQDKKSDFIIKKREVIARQKTEMITKQKS